MNAQNVFMNAHFVFMNAQNVFMNAHFVPDKS